MSLQHSIHTKQSDRAEEEEQRQHHYGPGHLLPRAGRQSEHGGTEGKVEVG